MALLVLENQLGLYLLFCQIFQVVLVFQDVLQIRVLLRGLGVLLVLLVLAVRVDLHFQVFRVIQPRPKINQIF